MVPPADVTKTNAVERLSPRADATEVAEHLARYRWATESVKGRIVLDVACGAGLGFLSLGDARLVIGCDLSMEALLEARSYDFRPHLVQASALSLPLADCCVDVVVSFETIEHLEDGAAFIIELHRVLKPGGLLMLSTPNGLYTKLNDEGQPTNPFHRREYTPADLRALLEKTLVSVELRGQIVDRSFGVSPFWDPAPDKRPRVERLRMVVWKLLGRLPKAQRLTRLILRQSRHPSVNDWRFELDRSDGHVLVATARKRPSDVNS